MSDFSELFEMFLFDALKVFDSGSDLNSIKQKSNGTIEYIPELNKRMPQSKKNPSA